MSENSVEDRIKKYDDAARHLEHEERQLIESNRLTAEQEKAIYASPKLTKVRELYMAAYGTNEC